MVFSRDDVWRTTAEIPYWWCVTIQIWVVLLIGWSKFPLRHDQSQALPRSRKWHVISMEFLCSFLRRRFSWKQVVAWQNVGCFLRLLDRRLLNWPSFRPQNTPNLSEQDQKASLQHHWTGTTDHVPVGRSGHGWSCSNVPPLLYPCEPRLQSTGTSNWDPAEDLTKENTIKKTNRRLADPRPA